MIMVDGFLVHLDILDDVDLEILESVTFWVVLITKIVIPLMEIWSAK